MEREINQAWVVMFNREHKYNVGFCAYYNGNDPHIRLVGEHTDRREFRQVEVRLAGMTRGEIEGGITGGVDEGRRCLVGIINIAEKPTLGSTERFREACISAGFTKVKVDQIVYE